MTEGTYNHSPLLAVQTGPEGDRAIRVTWAAKRGRKEAPLALSLRFGTRLVRALTEALAPSPEVLDVVSSLQTVTVILTVEALNQQGLTRQVRSIARQIAASFQALPDADAAGSPGTGARTVTVPVRYGGLDGPDLPALAAWAGITQEEAVLRHTSVTYECFAVGFRPGMPFLAPVDPVIAAPRLDQPRLEVAAGSVAVAGRQTGIYPVVSIGGWRLLGRTPMVLFDPTQADAERGSRIHPGDRVRFWPDADGTVVPR